MNPSAQGRQAALLGLLLLWAASIPWKGYRLGGSNQSIQIPLLKQLVDPSLYRGDLLPQSFDGYATFFFALLAPLVRLVGDLEPLYFVLYAAFHLLALGAVFAIARLLVADHAAGLLACVLYLLQPGSPGGELTYWPRLTHAHAATAILLWALWLHLRGRTTAALILSGLTANLHALYAAHLAALVGFDMLWTARARGPRRTLTPWLGFALLASPVIFWILMRSQPVPAEALPAWLEVLRERSAIHAFPAAVPAAVYGRYALLLALAALAGSERGEPRRAAERMVVGVGVLSLVALVFSEWLPSVWALTAQPLRAAKWLTYLLLPFLAEQLLRSWRAGGLARAAAVVSGAGLLLSQSGLLALGLALFLLEPARCGTARIAAGCAALALAAATGATEFTERMGVQQLTALLRDVLGDPLVVACLVLALLLRATRRRALRALAVAVVLVYVLPGAYRLSRDAVRGEAWTDAQLWVRGHAPRDAVVLTPPQREGFRVFSERAIVGEWKDGTQQFFAPWEFTREWRERMRALAGETSAFDGFPPERLAELARRYGASYLVFPVETELPWPRLHENSELAVYRLPGAADAR